MSLKAFSSVLRPLQLAFNGLKISVTGTPVQQRCKSRYTGPKLRYPYWYTKQHRTKYEEDLTPENKEFIEQVVQGKYGPATMENGFKTYSYSPLLTAPVLRGTWFPNCRRCGLIGIKIGIVPQWLNTGKVKIMTMIQILDNHVVNYIPPEKNKIMKRKYAKRLKKEGKLGALIVGSVNCDPQNFTAEYNGLFTRAGVMPKRILTRFPVHPQAAIQPGTPLYAAHFEVGHVVDISGVTIYRGFQGVMKRWGFHGQPASHGATKTHRRPGNIGSGGKKARVWPGTKMPGVMGNKLRTAKGVKIWRIDHKYNVLYVSGKSIPGNTNSFVYVHDTILPLKKLKSSPRFPTYYPEDHQKDPLPEEEFDPELFNFTSPTIMFPESEKQKESKKGKK